MSNHHHHHHHHRRQDVIPTSRVSSISQQSNNIRNHMSATRARSDKLAHAAAVAAATAMRSDVTPPLQVTFEGDTGSAETLSTTASSSSHHPPSPARSQASSEVSRFKKLSCFLRVCVLLTLFFVCNLQLCYSGRKCR